MHLHRAAARRRGTVRPQRARLADRPKVERLPAVLVWGEPRRGVAAGAGHSLLLQVDHKGALREAALVVALLGHLGHQFAPGVHERLPGLAPASPARAAPASRSKRRASVTISARNWCRASGSDQSRSALPFRLGPK